jgi:hypothetical protein
MDKPAREKIDRYSEFVKVTLEKFTAAVANALSD